MTDWNDICFLHVDLDAFFASVEQLDNPEYRGKPIIVGGKPSDRRAVVSTASYEARKFGVHSAMPTAKAYQLCPQGIFVHPRMNRYQEKSQEVMDIFAGFSPEVRQISVDEAFINLSGTQRLFGNPSDTALRLKKEVKEKTGLTVSIGLSQNRYIAKIASGLSKPDGFYEVQPGKEEEFMLKLPLEKVWGIGSKTLQHLYSAGLRTTQEIHKRSQALLESLFGNATGAFLYNAVRGKEVETFSEAKSHSLSAETTFSFDLTDRYAIGTALMELSCTVMFRLLRHNLTSRTAALKIRYGDFTTVTVQETSGSELLSSEELFERSQALFDKKYDANLGGIRLLGVAVQNIGISVSQQELFNEKAEKKRAVEKSILALQNKNPLIKIKKARLLTDKLPLFAAVLGAALALFTPEAAAETMNTTEASGAGSIVFDESVLPPKTPAEDSVSLFNHTIHDNNIEFLAKGYWESVMSGTTEATFGFGNALVFSYGTPVFTQKVDLTLWFMLNNTWYFEAAFADGFDKNTVAAGYYGEGILKEARLANRGITFPSTYSIDTVNRGIGGGDNQAPGVSLHFEDSENNKWKGDFAFRYDMLSSRDKTYYGLNSVADNSIAPSSYLSGQIYVLPGDSDIISNIQDIFVESSSGSYKDLQGRTYKKLSSSDYMIFPAKRQLILSTTAGAAIKSGVVPAVAVSFSSSATYTSLITELGTYGTVTDGTVSGASGFLGDVQKFFGEAADYDDTVKRPNVASYSYGGLSSDGTHPVPDKTGIKTDGFFSFIGGTSGTKVLFIQHPAGFSPFAAAFRYDGGTAAVNDAVVASSSTGTASDLYSAIAADDDITFVTSDFFSETHTYVDVYGSDVNSGSANAAVNPAVRYPLADTSPGYYLGYAAANDLRIRLRTYTAVSRFDIGTDAVEGTVRLYKNGVIDSAAKYNKESGTITPASSVSNSDRIYITWYEESSSSDSGAITMAAGYSRMFTPNLSGDLSFSTRWAYDPNKEYADSSSSEPGFATVANGIQYKTDNFEIGNTVAATIESDNVTGNYRILGMSDNSPSTVYLTEGAGVNLPDNFTPSLNTRGTDTSYPALSGENNGSVSAKDGSTDSEISGYKIPVSWNFSSKSGKAVCAWAATAINLGSGGANLASGTEFSIAIKSDDTAVSGYDVYLQLGVKASDDFSVEDTGSIPTWKISDSSAADVENPFTATKSGFAGNVVKVRLTDADRARFTANYSARIVVVVNASTSDSGSGNTISSKNQAGTIWIGPYEVQVQGIFTSQADNLTVTTSQTTTTGLSGASKFNSSTNYVENVNWKNTITASPQEASDLNIVMARYFSEVDITPYPKINLFFRYESTTGSIITDDVSGTTAFTLILDCNASVITKDGKTAVRIEIPQSSFKKYVNASWHKLSIDRIEKTVSIDGDEVSTNKFYVDSDVVPVRLKMIVATAIDGKAVTEGTFSFDELNLSGAKEHYILEDTLKTSYKKDGTFLSAGNFPILADFSVSAQGNGAATIQKVDTSANKQAAGGNVSAKITFATIALSGDAAHSTDSSQKLSSAGHKVQTTVPVLGLFSGGGEYRYDVVGKTLDKKNNASVNFQKLHIPLDLSGNTEAISNSWSVTQNSAATSTVRFGTQSLSYTLSANAGVSQKLLPSSSKAEKLDTNSYQQGWGDSTAFAFSTGKSNASRRTVKAGLSNTFTFPFARFSPAADFSTEGKYTSSTATLFTDTSKINVSFPFSIGPHSITFKWAKEAGGISEAAAGGNYEDDYTTLSGMLKNRTYLFKSIPFYDMASTSISDTILEDSGLDTSSTESLYYSTVYSATWKRPIYGNTRDLLIPASISLSAARDIKTTATVSDIYQYKGTLNYTAFNIFGENGSLMKTTWYKQDEYTASFSAAAKIPRGSGENKYEYAGYIQGNFYFNDTDSVRSGGEITFESAHVWSLTGTFVWKRRGKISPIVAIITLFKPELDTKGIILTRTDSLNVSSSESETSTTTNSTVKRKQAFELNHALDIKMNKYLTIISKLAESYTCSWSDIILVSITASIGARIEF